MKGTFLSDRIFWLALVGTLLVNVNAWTQDGFVRREGQHIKLVTDLDDSEFVQDLVDGFDAAVPQWEAFWDLPKDSLNDWMVEAFVMRDKAAFRRAGLIPDTVPDLPFGYAVGNRLWVVAQPSEYYTRHLLLHEGVHALAFKEFGGAGPSWFMEGTAELLSVHTGSGKSVKINRVPTDRESVPLWGRFTLMQQKKSGGIPSIESIMKLPKDLKSDVESYAWSWSAAMMFSGYPEYQSSFQQAARRGNATDTDFNRALHQSVRSNWPIVAARWRLMCHDLDYGFDWSRERVDISIQDPRWDGRPLQIKVLADAGWQSAGPRLPAGAKIEITPTGRIVLANQPKPWVSEPSGITIRYHRGRPLGQLLAVVLPNATPPEKMPDLQPIPITGLTKLKIDQTSWLLFRVNDFPGELGDNQGEYTVTIKRQL